MPIEYFPCAGFQNDFEKTVTEQLLTLQADGLLMSNILLPNVKNRDLPNEHDIVLLLPWAAYAVDCKALDAGEYRIPENGPVDVTAFEKPLQQKAAGVWKRTPLRNPFHVASQKAKVLRSAFITKIASHLSSYPVEGIIAIPDDAHVTPDDRTRTFRLRVCRVSELVRAIVNDAATAKQTADQETLKAICEKLGSAVQPLAEGATFCGIHLRKRIEQRREPGLPVDMQVYEGEEDGTSVQVEARIYEKPLTSEDGKRFIDCICKRIQAVRTAYHPKVMQVVQFVTGPTQVMIAFKHFEGESLGQLVERSGRLAPDLVLSLSRQLARTVSDLHRLDVIHLDLRPENVLIAPDVHSHLGERHLLTGLTSPLVDKNRIFTVTFHNNFDASFSAPEIWTTGQAGLRGKPQNDVYSLGRIAAFCLLGHEDYLGWAENNDSVGTRDLPKGWVGILSRACDPSWEARYTDMQAFLNALSAL